MATTSTAAAAVAVAAVADGGVTDAAAEKTTSPAPALAPAPAPLPFRPRVLTLGRPQQQSLPQKKRPAPSSITAAAVEPANKAPSTLWRRHEHGSYTHYYFRRKPGSGGAAGPNGTEDARLALLQEEWFRGKAHLDIGTNTGKVAWEIYQRFRPARVLGVDIDPGLIETARTKLRHACRRDGIEHGAAVAFECRDFVCTDEDEKEGVEKFDVVTCLSVAKHIHLQGGDPALLLLFRRAHALLRPGGRFILEPQPWRSYRKRKHASAESARHYASLCLRPPFTDVLLGPEVGFTVVEALGVPPSAAEGYRRPLYCFVKAAKEA